MSWRRNARRTRNEYIHAHAREARTRKINELAATGFSTANPSLSASFCCELSESRSFPPHFRGFAIPNQTFPCQNRALSRATVETQTADGLVWGPGWP